MMADESDDCRDVVTYWKVLNEGYDCVFGSRFVKGGGTIDYPWLKLKINRLANFFLRILFRISLNDTTNAFKAYRRTVIDGCRPFLSPHFNLTVEIPLKAIVRGYTWKVVPITWRNRRAGEPKLKIKEMGSRYLFICLYVWLEKYFSRGDYKRSAESAPAPCWRLQMLQHPRNGPLICDTGIPHNIALISISVLGVTVLWARTAIEETPFVCNRRPRLQITYSLWAALGSSA